MLLFPSLLYFLILNLFQFSVCYSASLPFLILQSGHQLAAISIQLLLVKFVAPFQLKTNRIGRKNRLNPPSSHFAVGKVWLAARIPSILFIPALKHLSLITEEPSCRRDQELEFSAGQIKLKVLSLTSDTQPLQSAHLKTWMLKSLQQSAGRHIHSFQHKHHNQNFIDMAALTKSFNSTMPIVT